MTGEPTKQISIVYFDAGSGHRSAARALERALAGARPNWRIRMVNVTEVFAPHPRFHRIVCAGIDYFNWMLKHERVFYLRGLINLSLLFHDLLTPRDLMQIAAFWTSDLPDAVVSVTPMYNPALYQSARLANPGVRCITIPVDFEEAKPRYWFTPKVAQHYLLASERLVAQARLAGVPNSSIQTIPGMMIDPGFYQPPLAEAERLAELTRLGLDPKQPTGLISFGGQGSTILREIAVGVGRSPRQPNMIFLCGRSREAYAALSARETPYPKLVLGYKQDTPIRYYQLADFVIGKPGTMTITEALVAQKPLIAIKSRGMRPVQAGNERWLQQHGLGVVVPPASDIDQTLDRVLSDHSYGHRAARARHNGVFAAAELICTHLEAAEASRSVRSAPALAH
jgi:processive 1,2-diacylglycerol beta-glucosyltransferase